MSYQSCLPIWLRGVNVEEMIIYVDVDSLGNVTNSVGGTNPKPEREYMFFFIRDKITLDNILKFKVVLNFTR